MKNNNNTNVDSANVVNNCVVVHQHLVEIQDGKDDGGKHDNTTTNVSLGDNNSKEVMTKILLQCAVAHVCNPDENLVSRSCLLFDGCSQRTYITNELQKQLRLPCVRKESLILRTFVSYDGRLQKLDVVQVCVKVENGVNVYMEALCVPFICSKLKVPSVNLVKSQYVYLQDVKLAEPPTSIQNVDILVDLDYYFSFVSGKIIRGNPGNPVAVESILGWMVCGPTQLFIDKKETFNNLIRIGDSLEGFGEESELKCELKKFWEVESVSEDINEKFNENVYFNGKRYVSSLPFKPDITFVPDNYNISYKRLMGLLVKLEKDPKLKVEYMNIFSSYEKDGIIERVYDNGVPGGCITYLVVLLFVLIFG